MTAIAALNRRGALQTGDPHEYAPRLHNRNSSARRPAGAPIRRDKPLVRLSLLSGMALHVGDREIALTSRKAKALIAYLALAPGMKETRDRLVGLLWSEAEDAKARASLRQVLHVLREVFDKEDLVGFSTDKLHVSLGGSAFETDLDCALASVDRGDPLDCIVDEMRITDTFLSGYDDIDPSFGSWLRVKRESVRQRLIRGLEAQLSDTSHLTESTKRVARALFQVDPTHETACQKLMCAYADSGDIAGALAAYKQLWESLEEDHDIEPSAATQEVVVAIKSGTYRPPMKGFGLGKPSNVAAAPEEAESMRAGATATVQCHGCGVLGAINQLAHLPQFLPNRPCPL
jgi:DNA-binding SARP family transcriptional activator